jgi:hypothetical protein
MTYKLFEISASSDLDALTEHLPEDYEPDFVIAQLKVGLDARCARILVEDYYNDKDYRSTYYHYYAKKGYRYEPNCVRLHFFDHRVKLLPGCELRFEVKTPQEKPSETYFGYMVLRPTGMNTIGRTVLSPAAIKGFHGCVIEAEHKVHLLGHRLTVKGFPYMSQHSDISVCAHAACWAILRHYSERFPRYAEFLTYDITRMAHEFDPGGLLPSVGLHVGHAERVFATAGTYPMLVVKTDDEPGQFRRQLFAYVESGFPLFAEIERITHAVAIIGHTGLDASLVTAAPCHFASDQVQGLVVVDDNVLPYHAVATGHAEPYGCSDFTAFIVPLPDKVYYSAEAVDNVAILLANEEHFGFDHEPLGSPIVRYFLTTASHIRHFMNNYRSQFDPELVSIVMQLSLPQFVWIIEIAAQEQWKNGHVSTRVIIDATASPFEEFPIYLMHDQHRAYVCDRGGDQEHLQVKLRAPGDAPLSRMPGNLETH